MNTSRDSPVPDFVDQVASFGSRRDPWPHRAENEDRVAGREYETSPLDWLLDWVADHWRILIAGGTLCLMAGAGIAWLTGAWRC